MKEKLRKLFRGTEEDQIIACNLLVTYCNVDEFLEEWHKEDSTVYKFQADNKIERQGVLFVPENKVPKRRLDPEFYYKYELNRWLLCNSEEIVVCHEPYDKGIKVITHER